VLFLTEQPPKLTGLNVTYTEVMGMSSRRARHFHEMLLSIRKKEIEAYRKASKR
jgi:hypothetical protein